MTNAANLIKVNTTEEPATDAEPGTEATTPALRDMFQHYVRSFTALFSDGVGRIATWSARQILYQSQ
jgi:hypothetical protein